MSKDQKIVIIDYKVGNLSSIANMLKKVGQRSLISDKPEDIETADKLILPGVGAFDYGITQLNNSGLSSVLNKKACEEKIPFLGICLGAQLLTQSSEEGVLPGLGWFQAKTVKFKFDPAETKLKIPHMGWTDVTIEHPSPLTIGLEEEARFYFVHSFHFTTEHKEEILLKSVYGYEFVSALHRDNIYAVQFHPEKSHKFGLQVMKNFVEI